ncbi:hypothetical protein CBM2609_B110023 [Cupriavidus taiwanensis]|nr:hypothetical protein CBM2604_B120022 [Cupriavidus taiwanensis]SOZ30305.1 hypothetical protein CBM2609_B110023 [Cupriavidus taiwanensis]SOZ49574.1 hypothetical protein CBM2610_B90023 [Cupriavidus taiwanensis]
MNAASLPPERGFISYTDGTTVFEGYLARPAGMTSRTPCVVLAHEWSGLNAAMRRCADRFAALGYPCFAADVYGKGVRGDEQGDNAHLMDPLMDDRRSCCASACWPGWKRPGGCLAWTPGAWPRWATALAACARWTWRAPLRPAWWPRSASTACCSRRASARKLRSMPACCCCMAGKTPWRRPRMCSASQRS